MVCAVCGGLCGVQWCLWYAVARVVCGGMCDEFGCLRRCVSVVLWMALCGDCPRYAECSTTPPRALILLHDNLPHPPGGEHACAEGGTGCGGKQLHRVEPGCCGTCGGSGMGDRGAEWANLCPPRVSTCTSRIAAFSIRPHDHLLKEDVGIQQLGPPQSLILQLLGKDKYFAKMIESGDHNGQTEEKNNPKM